MNNNRHGTLTWHVLRAARAAMAGGSDLWKNATVLCLWPLQQADEPRSDLTPREVVERLDRNIVGQVHSMLHLDCMHAAEHFGLWLRA